MLELKDFEAAYNKVQEVVLPTKLIKSDYFSEQTGNDVYLKPENMQLTGATKSVVHITRSVHYLKKKKQKD